MEALQSLWECDDELPDFDDADDDELQRAPALPASAHAFPEDDDLRPAPALPASAQASPQEPLEDGEIGTVSGSLDPDSSFQFKANDLDTAIQSAMNNKKTKKRGRKKKKSDQKKVQEMDPKAFIACTSRYLKEPKWYLIEAAVARFGMDVVRDLVHEVETIEENGGQMIASGKRRRTPGGVLWNVLRSRYEEDYKAIMEAGRSFERQQRQQKRKVEVNDMLIDGQPSTKRRRGGVSEAGMAPPAAQVKRTGVSEAGMTPLAAQVKRTGVTTWPSRMQKDDIQYRVDLDNSSSAKRVQNAWAEGVKKAKHITSLRDVDMLDDAMNKRPLSVAERLRVPIQYGDL